jgi:hypothetical protein
MSLEGEPPGEPLAQRLGRSLALNSMFTTRTPFEAFMNNGLGSPRQGNDRNSLRAWAAAVRLRFRQVRKGLATPVGA